MTINRQTIFAALIVIVVANSSFSTQLTVSIENGADSKQLWAVWSAYTSFWSAHSGDIECQRFTSALGRCNSIADASTASKLSVAETNALSKVNRDPDNYVQVCVFLRDDYYYVILSRTAASPLFKVYPCFMLAFDKQFKHAATFYG